MESLASPLHTFVAADMYGGWCQCTVRGRVQMRKAQIRQTSPIDIGSETSEIGLQHWLSDPRRASVNAVEVYRSIYVVTRAVRVDYSHHPSAKVKARRLASGATHGDAFGRHMATLRVIISIFLMPHKPIVVRVRSQSPPSS